MSGDKPAPGAYTPEVGSEAREFDAELAQSYVGRTIIVGLTYLDHSGNFLEQRQLHGEVVSASPEGILIALHGTYAGQTWSMPPDLESIRSAPAGEYRFQETGEVVADPDLMATWTVTAPVRQ
jgi:hypothetical protein